MGVLQNLRCASFRKISCSRPLPGHCIDEIRMSASRGRKSAVDFRDATPNLSRLHPARVTMRNSSKAGLRTGAEWFSFFMIVTALILSPSCPVFAYSAVVDTHHSSCRTFSGTGPVLRPASFGTPSPDAGGGCHRQCVPYNQRLLPGEPSMLKKQFCSSFYFLAMRAGSRPNDAL